ncbi:unnamed protein product, partial [Ectocarpus sp. 4 AP-2014]
SLSSRPEALSTNKLSVNTRATDLESVMLSGIDIFLTVSQRSSITAFSCLSSWSSRVSLPLSAFWCSLGRMSAFSQHLMTVWSEKLSHFWERISATSSIVAWHRCDRHRLQLAGWFTACCRAGGRRTTSRREDSIHSSRCSAAAAHDRSLYSSTAVIVG